MKYVEGRPGGFDPHARIPDMDLDGIDAAFLYPSVGLFSGAVQEPGLAAAMCRAYNRWLADYCQPYPDRLFGVAMLPMQSIDLAIEEMRFARKELGMRGGFLRPNPVQRPHAAPPGLRAVLERGRGARLRDRPARGRQRRHAAGRRRPLRDARGPAHHLAHHGDDAGRDERDLGRRLRPLPAACASPSWSRAAAGSRRGSTGWTATSTTRASTTPGCRCARASCSSATAGSRSSPSRAASSVLADYIGPHKILWATDYPHPDGFFPGAPEADRRPAGAVGGDEARRSSAGGAMGFYGLDRTRP